MRFCVNLPVYGANPFIGRINRHRSLEGLFSYG
jgi:hypothetical protein